MVRATQPQYNLRAELAKLKNEPGRKVSPEFIAEIEAHLAATDNPHGVTAAQVGALGLGGGTITGPIVKDGPGDWGSFRAQSTNYSYMSFKKFTGTNLGYFGADGGGITSVGNGDGFGIRAENDLILAAGGNSLKAKLDSAGRFTVVAQPFVDAHVNGGYSLTEGWTRCPNIWSAVNNTGSHFSLVSSRFVAPVSGRYYVSFSAEPVDNYSSPIYLSIWKNGLFYNPTRRYSASIGGRETRNTAFILYLNETDYVEPWVYVNSNTNFDNSGHFNVVLLS